MSRPGTTPNFEGKRAIVLHRPHELVDALARQLSQLGMSCEPVWPTLNSLSCDALFFDVDMGHDEQFPWPAEQAPMPAIALSARVIRIHSTAETPRSSSRARAT